MTQLEVRAGEPQRGELQAAGLTLAAARFFAARLATSIPEQRYLNTQWRNPQAGVGRIASRGERLPRTPDARLRPAV